MREAFARWACNPVTQLPGEGLQENNSNISCVTHVTHVTQEKQQPQLCTGVAPVQAAEADLNKNRVTRVTRVTNQESLDKSCNPNIRGRVTGLQNATEGLTADEWREAEAWPVPTGRTFLAMLHHLEAQGADYDAATVRAYQTTKDLIAHLGGPVQLKSDGDWPALPAGVYMEVTNAKDRLVADGYAPERAQELAEAIVAGRLGWELPALRPLDPDRAREQVEAFLIH